MKLSEKIRNYFTRYDGYDGDVVSQYEYDEWIDKLAKLETKNDELKRGVESAHLHLLASICECGEPLEETDAFDVLDALLADKQENNND